MVEPTRELILDKWLICMEHLDILIIIGGEAGLQVLLLLKLILQTLGQPFLEIMPLKINVTHMTTKKQSIT